jgi:phage terminase small subunit|tara:strand:- start:70 stop:549 length:480 start_codon:yes stop_codon:yes gene_type:complete
MTDKKLKTLTELEKNFAELYVENMFSNDTLTNRDIAIAAGYAKESAHQRAYENTTYKLKPHVVHHIEMLKEDFRIRNQITPEKHMARLNEIHKTAFQKGQLHTSLNAEVYRGKVAGYYVEKQLIKQEESEEEVERKLKEIIERYDLLTSHEEGKKDETK